MVYGIYIKHLNKSALFFAACRNHTEVFKLLLEQEGIDINIQTI